ncbi:MAG: hypothetical protein PF961_06825 [Planctomycetota bacterium]|jgi:hypothetical protein|nr:hypothetical protein [Planctomycetota bacterium]
MDAGWDLVAWEQALGGERLDLAFRGAWCLVADAAAQAACTELFASGDGCALLGWQAYRELCDPMAQAAVRARSEALLVAACAAPSVRAAPLVCAYRGGRDQAVGLEPACVVAGVSPRWLHAVAGALDQQHVYSCWRGWWRLWVARRDAARAVVGYEPEQGGSPAATALGPSREEGPGIVRGRAGSARPPVPRVVTMAEALAYEAAASDLSPEAGQQQPAEEG